ESDLEKTEAFLEGKHDEEFVELANEELVTLQERKLALTGELEDLLLEDDPDASRSIIMEIRGGTGGLEASLFAGELFRMYSKYARSKGWKVDVMNTSVSEAGGLREVVFSVEGNMVYKFMKYESGVHRVQRVPVTEASGRIHTSAVTVAVLPEAEDVDIKIDPSDLRVDVFRSAGCGGQSVNTTDSAVRITHLPTNIVVSCQDERSQLKNKNKAMKVLRSRLFDLVKRQQMEERSKNRKTQVGSGDRSEKIRTYNFPDRRITDHRIGFTVHNLEAVLEGEIDAIIAALLAEDKKRKLKEASE
ncbi:MAG: peptide chain release factor 1, partial [Candidatus Omnitrophota bacterium]